MIFILSGDPLGRQLLLQLVLILVNAFFAATEIAMLSLNANKLKKMIDEGDKKAAKLLKLVESPSGFLSAIQIGITFAGFLGSAFASGNFAERLVNWLVNDLKVTVIPRETLDVISIVVITLILSYFTLVLGELVPKRIGMQKPLVVAKFAVSVLTVASVLFKPLIWLLSASTNILLRIMRLKTEAEEETVTEEEIRFMVDVGEEKGTINPEEKEMIENIFEFNNSTARDVMTYYKDLEAVCLEDSEDEIVDLINTSGYSRFPVYEEDIKEITGVLIAKEYLLNRISAQPKPLSEIIRDPYYVPETVHTDVLFRDMQQKKQHFAIVVNEYGETSGVVTMEDLIEEILGNIYDETDTNEEEPQIVQTGENLWTVDGAAELDDVEKALDIEFDDDVKCDTIGGLVFSQLKTIPDDGEAFDVEVAGLAIHVDGLCDRRVASCVVSKLEQDEESEAEDK